MVIITSNNSSTSMLSISLHDMKSMTSNFINKWKSTQSSQSVTKTFMQFPVIKHSPCNHANYSPSEIIRLHNASSRKKIVTESSYVVAKTVLDSVIKKVELHDRKEKRKHENIMYAIKKESEKEFARQQTSKKIVTESSYEVAKTVLDSVIKKVELHDRKEKRKHENIIYAIKKESEKEFARQQTNLEIKRNNLRYAIMRKREIMEALFIQELERELFPKLSCILNLEKLDKEEAMKSKLDHEEAMKRKEEPVKRKEEQMKRREEKVKRKEGNMKRKEEQIKRKRVPLKRKEEPIKRKKEPMKRKEEIMKKKKEPMKRKEEPMKSKILNKFTKHKRKSSNGVSVDVAKKKKSDTKVDLYCVCRTPFDETQFYVGCDLCNGWFHGSCVDITEEEAESIDKYICGLCNQQKMVIKEEELYCICRQPYDENKFYIACDSCQDWFHSTCVATTKDKEYRCSSCRKKIIESVNSKPLTEEEIDRIKLLHRSLINHEMALPFMKPIYKNDLYEKSNEPMDLQTVGTKLVANSYSTLADFVNDVFRIFDDCSHHNSSDRCAEVLESYFVQKINEFINKIC